jgi:hypothetical protein
MTRIGDELFALAGSLVAAQAAEMGARKNAEEQSEKCEICGATCLNCGCAECNWCGQIADPLCYVDGHLNEPDREAAIARAKGDG